MQHTPAAERKLGLAALKLYAVSITLALAYIYFFSVDTVKNNVLVAAGSTNEKAVLSVAKKELPPKPKEDTDPRPVQPNYEQAAKREHPANGREPSIYNGYLTDWETKVIVNARSLVRGMNEKPNEFKRLLSYNSNANLPELKFNALGYLFLKNYLELNLRNERVFYAYDMNDPLDKAISEASGNARGRWEEPHNAPQGVFVSDYLNLACTFYHNNGGLLEQLNELYRGHNVTCENKGALSEVVYIDSGKRVGEKVFQFKLSRGIVGHLKRLHSVRQREDVAFFRTALRPFTNNQLEQYEQDLKSFAERNKDIESRRESYIASAMMQYQNRVNAWEARQQKKAIAATQPEQQKAIAAHVSPEVKQILQRPDFRADAWKFTALAGGFLVLFIYVIAGNKTSIIKKPVFIPDNFFLFSIPFFVAYGLLVHNSATKAYNAWPVIFAIVPPLLVAVSPVYWIVFKEWAKEHPFYRNMFILGKKGGSGRWGGVREYLRRDVSSYMQKVTPAGAPKTKHSPLYLGVTDWVHDYQVTNRQIASVSEQHHILASGSGGGKSRDALTNMLTAWNSGGLVFDIKGEHWRTISRKAGAKYLVDPYGMVKGAKGSQWNPLAEIDPEKATARALLQRVCEAIVIEKGDSKNGEHFKENSQTILRGFIAHLLTQYPEDKRNLPAVYDLFKTGYFKGEEAPRKKAYHQEGEDKGKPMLHEDGTPVMVKMTPKQCLNKLLKDMEKNEAIGAAPRDAAMLLNSVGENERGSYYSTIARAIDWVNDETVRPVLSGSNDFSLQDIKTREAWTVLAIPENFLDQQMRFVRVFFQIALDLVDNYNVARDSAHERQQLFVFEEFNKFGYFKAAEDVVCFKRSSGVKGVFVVQNLGQLKRHYPNAQDFFSNCDMQVFGFSSTDHDGLNIVSKALGTYREPLVDERGNTTYRDVPVFEPQEIKEKVDGSGKYQIFVPVHGQPIVLKRRACFKNFSWTRI